MANSHYWSHILAAITLTTCNLEAEAQGNCPGASTFQAACTSVTNLCYDYTLDNYDKYSREFPVERNKPSQDFPDQTGDIESYLMSAGTPPIVLLVFVLILCCCCCCYQSLLWQRLDNDGKAGPQRYCWPSEKWGKDEWWSKLAIVIFGITILCWLILNIIALRANSESADAIRDIPDIIEVYADYLTEFVADALKCVVDNSQYVVANATNMGGSGNATEQGHLSQISAFSTSAINDIGETAADGVRKSVLDFGYEIGNFSQDAREGTNYAADQYKSAIDTVLGIFFLCGIITLACVLLAGTQPSVKSSHYHYANVMGCCMTCLMCLGLIITATLWFLLRASGGFCYDPFNIMSKASLDDVMEYYVGCSTYDTARLQNDWVFESERCEAQQEFENIRSSYDALVLSNQVTSSYSDEQMANLNTAIVDVQCAYSGDAGVLGYLGILSCGLVDRSLQKIIIQFCTKYYGPLDSIFLCIFLLSLLIIWVIINGNLLRREPNRNQYDATHTGDMPNPTFEKEESGVVPQYPQPPPYESGPE